MVSGEWRLGAARADSKMEEGRFRLDDFELYKIVRDFRKRAYRLMKQLPTAEKYARPLGCE